MSRASVLCRIPRLKAVCECVGTASNRVRPDVVLDLVPQVLAEACSAVAMGQAGPTSAFLEVVAARIHAHVPGLRDMAAHDSLLAQIVTQGGADALEATLAELAHFT